MRSAKTIIELTELLKGIKAHKEIGDEIMGLVLKTGYEKQFIKIFSKRLEEIKLFGKDVVNLSNFEKLKKYNGLYSMHIKSKNFNLRILYSYLKNDEILLHCFYEREGKLKSEYETHAPIALSRKGEMEE